MGIRRSMEELFKSWKHPIPESRDPRPVFPPEVTQPIDAALIKFRSVNLKAKQEEEQSRLQKMRMAQLPSRVTGNFPPRQTPPPTGAFSYRPPPPTVGQNSNANSTDIASMMSALQRGSTPNYPPAIRSPAPLPSPVRQGVMSVNQSYPPPPQNSTPSQYTYSGLPPPHMSHEDRLNKLRADVQGLIESATAHLARNPYDNEKSKLLHNLTNLKRILDGGQLSLVHIQSTELVVANIAKDLPPLPPANAPSALPHIPPSLLASLLAGSTPQPTPPPQTSSAQPYATAIPPPIPQFTPQITGPSSNMPPVSMAQMMALLNTSTPTLSSATPATAPPATNSLLDQLRASGLLPGTPSSASVTPAPPPPPSFNFMNMQQAQAPSFQGQLDNDVRLESASLKM
jgi:pre-mRNA cleavage complex 2 protein Pcf11